MNRSPSFGTDAPLDYDIKNGVLSDAFKLLNVKYYRSCSLCVYMYAMCFIRPNDRHRCYALRKANSRRRLLLRSQKTDVSSLSISLTFSYKLWYFVGG